MLRALMMLLNMTGVPRLVLRLMMDRRVPLRLKLLMPAALVYLVSPIDLVSDIVPPLTYIDDVLVILLALAIFLAMAPRDVVLEHMRRPGGGSAEGSARRPRPKVIEGSYRIEDDDPESDR